MMTVSCGLPNWKMFFFFGCFVINQHICGSHHVVALLGRERPVDIFDTARTLFVQRFELTIVGVNEKPSQWIVDLPQYTQLHMSTHIVGNGLVACPGESAQLQYTCLH